MLEGLRFLSAGVAKTGPRNNCLSPADRVEFSFDRIVLWGCHETKYLMVRSFVSFLSVISVTPFDHESAGRFC